MPTDLQLKILIAQFENFIHLFKAFLPSFTPSSWGIIIIIIKQCLIVRAIHTSITFIMVTSSSLGSWRGFNTSSTTSIVVIMGLMAFLIKTFIVGVVIIIRHSSLTFNTKPSSLAFISSHFLTIPNHSLSLGIKITSPSIPTILIILIILTILTILNPLEHFQFIRNYLHFFLLLGWMQS